MITLSGPLCHSFDVASVAVAKTTSGFAVVLWHPGASPLLYERELACIDDAHDKAARLANEIGALHDRGASCQ